MSSQAYEQRSHSSSVIPGPPFDGVTIPSPISPKAEHQVQHPAPPDVPALAPAVFEDLGIGTTGFFQGVAQDRQAVEGLLVVDRPGDLRDQAAVPGEPGRVDDLGSEGIAEDLAEDVRVCPSLGPLG